ncbi:hypothetical protein LXA43DRAFT_997332 [Ganoderma leucocontextum]|nr:hypothetical protein LXA43DRAFT_997332 [Ganoderma leucocontextum]
MTLQAQCQPLRLVLLMLKIAESGEENQRYHVKTTGERCKEKETSEDGQRAETTTVESRLGSLGLPEVPPPSETHLVFLFPEDAVHYGKLRAQTATRGGSPYGDTSRQCGTTPAKAYKSAGLSSIDGGQYWQCTHLVQHHEARSPSESGLPTCAASLLLSSRFPCLCWQPMGRRFISDGCPLTLCHGDSADTDTSPAAEQ